MDDRKRQRANNDKTSSTTTTFTSSSSTSFVPNPLPTIISCWTPLHLLDSPLEPLELAATAPKKQKTTDTTCITCLEPQYVVCTDDVESSGRFLSEVLVDGKFLGTIRNQTTFKQALSFAEIGGGTLFIVGHSDKNFGYICKGKILISKALSLAQSKVSKIVFLMCYSSEMAQRSYSISQRMYEHAMQRYQEACHRDHRRHRGHRRKTGGTTKTKQQQTQQQQTPSMPFHGFVGIGHSCSTSGWGDGEELDLVSSVVLLVKALSRWPQRSWAMIARGVLLPTSASMDGAPSSSSCSLMEEEEVTFTSGVAYGRAAHDQASRVRREEQRARLEMAMMSLRRELYDGNHHANEPGGEEIT